MLLTLRILTYRHQPVPPAPAVRFDAQGGQIGRAPDNTLVLDDPSKYISRIHARVGVQDGAFVLEDLGSNPSVVNDRPLGKGCQVALAHGDRVQIGDYLLQAVLEAMPETPALAPAPPNDTALPLFEPPAPAPRAPLPPLEPVPAPTVHVAAAAAALAEPAFLDPLAGGSLLDVAPEQLAGHDDPLGLNLFAPAPAPGRPARAAESDHVSPELAALGHAVPVQARDPVPMAASVPLVPRMPRGGFAIPDDYDPLADLLAPRAPSEPPLAQPPPADSPELPVVPPCDPAPDAVAPPAPAAMAASQPAGESEPGHDAPHALSDSPPAVPAVRAAPAAPAALDTADASADAVLAALLRGLGLPGLQLQRPATEVAETVGAMLREATAGTIDVLMARALTKKESRIDMTMLSVRANNPLKFFPHAEGALTQMLTGSMSGYLEPVEAVAGAFDDLRAHELAVIAGMRAALAAVLHRFDPASIEARLAEPKVLDRLLASSRKARMWDRLVELYGEIAREAEDDLQRLYGEKFSEAYEEQVERLRQARR
ncbi:type VI secretion system-associated FHA domain protein TagH [Massilia sp. MS-15]|uniref:type VI secretion system-associated FHA domain protein TagH n=1 Tax=Massilia sp. MS-15 TaxID=2878200 RepID=UPI001CD5780C|nr:type VI secretion system-associated FHA domain protein TagH [Massilia sp. MS-15]MCA1245718.1 type VI secretion system-associated FHA domain protein TagH [Massilia sp. MS-15]